VGNSYRIIESSYYTGTVNGVAFVHVK
jgi:hypothetical protein